MAQTQTRLINMQALQTILNTRVLITNDMIGKRVRLLIQGNGNVVDVKTKAGELVTSTIPGYEGTVLQKKIFNVRANAQLAMKSALNLDDLRAGIAAEKAGKADEAHTLFNAYLNRAQISFGVLLPSPLESKLANGVEIAGTIQLIETDNGKLLTIDPSTISVVDPEVAGKTTFSLEDIFGEDTDNTEDGAKEAAELNAARMTVELISKTPAAKRTMEQKKAFAEAQAVIKAAEAVA
jgi:hypothetical protein